MKKKTSTRTWLIRFAAGIAAVVLVVGLLFVARQVGLLPEGQALLSGLAIFTALFVLFRQIASSGEIRELKEQAWEMERFEAEMQGRVRQMVDDARHEIAAHVKTATEREKNAKFALETVRDHIRRLESEVARLANAKGGKQITSEPETQADDPDKPYALVEEKAASVNAGGQPETEVAAEKTVIDTARKSQERTTAQSGSTEDTPEAAPVAAKPIATIIPQAVRPSQVSTPAPSIPASPVAVVQDKNLSLYLQPVVTLPDRNPVIFDSFMRLQTEDRKFVPHSKFAAMLREGGLMPSIDVKVVFSSVRMLKALSAMGKGATVFCSLSRETLNSDPGFDQIVGLLGTNKSLAGSLIFEVSQRDFAPLKGSALENLRALSALGFGFCVSDIQDFNLDPQELAARGVQFVKASASLLLHADPDGDTSGIHPSRLADALHGAGITLIATDVERENQIARLINMDVACASGSLFAPPRPVKAELLNEKPKTPVPDTAPPVALQAAV